MHFCHLSEWLAWLEGLKIVRSSAESVQEVKGLMDRLLLCPSSSAVIMVSGTNGKGSCVALLEAIYQTAGYNVGAFTSPHLFKFNERIRIRGKPVSDEKIVQALNALDVAEDSHFVNYFQYSFLAALLLFKQSDLDLIILEVGIGGRSDIVNAVDPDLSIITSIDLDHGELLGNTREAIAFDKAGIMRRGKPVICGDSDPPLVIVQEAARQGAILYAIHQNFSYQKHTGHWDYLSHEQNWTYLPLPSIQLSNAATVIQAVLCLKQKFPVSKAAVEEGLKQVYLPGRQEIISLCGKKILLDVAHNPAAIRLLAHKIDQLAVSGKVFAITGWQKDKDIAGALSIIQPFIHDWSLIPLPAPRGAGTHEVACLLNTMKVIAHRECATIQKALADVFSKMKKEDLLVIFGSFSTVSQAVEHFMAVFPELRQSRRMSG